MYVVRRVGSLLRVWGRYDPPNLGSLLLSFLGLLLLSLFVCYGKWDRGLHERGGR